MPETTPLISAASVPPGMRRRDLGRAAAALAGIPVLLGARQAAAAPRAEGRGSAGGWTGTWAAGPTGVPASEDTVFEDQTLRQVVHTSAPGRTLRLRLTNEFGTEPLVVGEAHLAHMAADGAGTAIVPESDRTVRVGGRTSATVPPGARRWSDPVALTAPAASDLVVSIYLPRRTGDRPPSSPSATRSRTAPRRSWTRTTGGPTCWPGGCARRRARSAPAC